MESSEKELIVLIKKYWYSVWGLFFLLIFESLFLPPYFWKYFNDEKIISRNEWGIIVLVCVATCLIWFRLTMVYPKNKKDKVGILIAIKTESKREFEILKNDFIAKLKKEIHLVGQEDIFHVFSLENNMAKKIQNSSDSIVVLKKTEAHLIVYGDCKKRTNGGSGKKSYFMDLHARVVHRQISDDLKKKFSEEITEAFRQKIIFNEDEEIKGFEVSSRLTEISVKYIVAIASYISWDFNLSLKILQDIKNQLKSEDLRYENLKKIKNRINLYKAKNHEALMRIDYLKYKKNKDKKIWRDMKKHLDFFQGYDPNYYPACLLRGMYYFLIDKNIKLSMKEILRGKNRRDLTWRYSEAFLYAYRGNIDKAEKIYSEAFKTFIEPDQIFQSEDFICDILEEDPNKCQLWYCLGVINLEAKDDKESAKIYFNNFLKCKSSILFERQIAKTKEYLNGL